MNICTSTRRYPLVVLLLSIASFAYGATVEKGVDEAIMPKKTVGEPVTLKNAAGNYLKMVRNSRGVVKPTFVSDQEDASVFTQQIAQDRSGRVGVSQKYFVYNNQYLSSDLTLHVKPTPECRWMAPVHYLYYNHFKAGDSQELIAEPVN